MDCVLWRFLDGRSFADVTCRLWLGERAMSGVDHTLQHEIMASHEFVCEFVCSMDSIGFYGLFSLFSLVLNVSPNLIDSDRPCQTSIGLAMWGHSNAMEISHICIR